MSSSNRFSEELRLIPLPAVVIAVVIFLCAVLGFGAIFYRNPDTAAWPPVAVLFMVAMIGVVFAIYALLVGYVNADAKRRGMGRLLWTLLVIFVPNGLGFILYFLMREPVQSVCPQCGDAVDADARYCTRCGRALAGGCPDCRAPVGPGDRFCANCGRAVGIEEVGKA